MDQKAARKLEKELEKAIADVLIRMGLKTLPLLPSRQAMHLMAKAAVSVYESEVEQESRNQDE